MRSTRAAGCAAAATAATITMTELSPSAETDQGESPRSFDAMMSATGNAMAKPRTNPTAVSVKGSGGGALPGWTGREACPTKKSSTPERCGAHKVLLQSVSED